MVKTFSKKNANKTQAQKISILSKRLSCSSMGIKLKNIIRDYSISDKLKTTFSSIILLTIIIMGISISVILFMNLRINSLYNGPYEALQVVSNIRVGLQEMDNNMYKAINASSEVSKDNAAIEKTKSSREICLENANNKALELEANVKTLKEIFKEDQSTVDELASDLEETEKSRKRLSEMIELNSAPEVVKTSLDTYSMYVNFTEVKIAKIYDVAQENAQQFINSSSVYRNFAIGFFIFMLLLIVMVSYTARKVLENVLLEGINHIKDIAKDLSDGKLKINKRYDSKDEIGKMSGDLIEAVSMLISYISDITKTLGELSNGKLDIKLDESIEYKGDFIPIRKSFENIISSLNNIFYNTHQSISLVSQ